MCLRVLSVCDVMARWLIGFIYDILQMFSSLARRQPLQSQCIRRLASAVSSYSASHGRYPSESRKMSTDAIQQKFVLPKRYEKSTISVW